MRSDWLNWLLTYSAIFWRVQSPSYLFFIIFQIDDILLISAFPSVEPKGEGITIWLLMFLAFGSYFNLNIRIVIARPLDALDLIINEILPLFFVIIIVHANLLYKYIW